MSARGRKPCLSLCWDCANSLKPWKCAWVRANEPIPGWWATPNKESRSGKLWSYHVISCPNFDRDSFRGGLERNLTGSNHETRIDKPDTANIAEAIIERAILDWKYINSYGVPDTKMEDVVVTKHDLIEFFFSEWFVRLLESFSYHSPEQIRKYIGITEDMNPTKKVMETAKRR